MLGFNHTLAGAITGIIIPLPAVPLVAFASHFALDVFPHFGRHAKFKPYTTPFLILLAADGILCLGAAVLGLWLAHEQWLAVGLGIVFSILPDLMWLLGGNIRQLKPFLRFSSMIQWGERPWGWILELIYGLILAIILLYLAY